MTSDSSLQVVLLKDEEQLNWGPIGQALAAHRHIPTLDTALEAKKCWGILGENLSIDEAGMLCSSMEKLKVKAVAYPHSSLVVLPPITFVSTVNFSNEYLSLTGETGGEVQLSWKDISILAAAALNTSTRHTIQEKQGPSGTQQLLNVGIMLATGLPIKIGPKKKTINKTVTDTNLSFVLDIVAKDSFQRFRIIPDDFNFSFLRERMVHGAMGNFHLLLTDLAAKAPQSRQSRGTRIILAGQPMTNMGYETLADLEKETRWLNAI